MKTKPASQFAFFNPRIILSFVLCLTGVFLTLLGYGASSNTISSPSNTSAPDVAAPVVEETEQLSPADNDGRFVHLIEFVEPGVLRRQEHTSGERFKAETPQAQAALEQIRVEQAVHVQAIANAIGHQPEVTHQFSMTHSGIATRLTPDEAQIVRTMPGVVSVERERVYQLDTFRSPFFIGADKIWDGTAVPGGIGTRGQGIVIADLDTGLIPTHPSFVNDASCGHGVGGAPNKLKSQLDCATATGPGGLCNGSSPNDTNGHGSHTASTAGGNVVTSSAVPSPSPAPIQGVAPCANIRMYKVCPTSSCPAANITGGINSVLLHGDVDVVNFSISGGNSPWTDNDRRFLDLVDAGIVVSASAGNTSGSVPNPVGNVAHLGPWVQTVAASTKDTGGTGDILASFSLRGPTSGTFQNLTKPDVTGPGVTIYAALISNYGNLSGTSMSCPHLTGSSALLRALQPTWLPSEVKSALMMTSFNGGKKENGTTPWDPDDVGTGRVDLTKVAKTGLVMNETFTNYLAANPATGGDPKTLNIPSVRNTTCTPSCTWTRTVRNTKTVPTSWTATGSAIVPGNFTVTVSPPSFNFTGSLTQTQVLTITATPLVNLTAAMAFGQVLFHETGAVSPDERITVAIKGVPGTSTPTPTPTVAPATPTPTATPAVSPTPGVTPTPTTSPGITPTPPATATPATPSPTPTSTVAPPTPTPTSTPPNPTPTPTATATAFPSPITFPDLVLTMTDSPDPVQMGHNLTYTITVSNVDPSLPMAATMTDHLPAGVNFVSANPSQGSCTGTSTVVCNLGSIAAGSNATVSLVVAPTTAGTLSNTASVPNFEDPSPGNNSATELTTVNPGPTPTATPPPTATPTPSATGTPATPSPTPTSTATPTPSTTPGAQAVNLSTRMNVRTGDNVGIGGFIITGTALKHVLLRAIGPSITGLPGVLADPVLELHGPAGFATITNDNWKDDPAQMVAILATGLAPTRDLEAAIDATLPPGAYTGVVKGNGNTTGIGLVEVYDLSQAVLSKLGNISTRALVGTGNDVVIAGFILGNSSGGTRIVVRGIGGSLSVLGVPNPLTNPTLELRNSSGAILASNDNWQDDQAQATELTNAGLAPTNPQESGIAITLGPGQYTALLSGVGNTTGVGVVEVFDRGAP